MCKYWKIEGRSLGPQEEIRLKNVKNINTYVGDSHPTILDASFDYIFSISVVEHVETEDLEAFFRDSLRMLKIGGKFLHAIALLSKINYDVGPSRSVG